MNTSAPSKKTSLSGGLVILGIFVVIGLMSLVIFKTMRESAETRIQVASELSKEMILQVLPILLERNPNLPTADFWQVSLEGFNIVVSAPKQNLTEAEALELKPMIIQTIYDWAKNRFPDGKTFAVKFDFK